MILLVILYLFDFIELLFQVTIPEVKQLGVVKILHPLLLEPLADRLDIFLAALADPSTAGSATPPRLTSPTAAPK